MDLLDTLSFTCQGRVDLRTALRTIKRQRPARAHVVWTYNDRKDRGDLPTIDLPEGTVLFLTVLNGLPFLHMSSGRVVFNACSSWGNSMTVHGGELHVRTDGAGRKVTVTVEPDDNGGDPKVTTAAAEVTEGSRLRLFDRRDRGATPTVVEDDTHGMPLAWTQAPIGTETTP